MESAPRGRPTSEVEVTNISSHGFWLWIEDREFFLPFEHFPWFREAGLSQILNVELPGPGHLYWPGLDVDLAVESLEHPERFPLVSRVGLGKHSSPGRENRSRRGVRRTASI